MKRFPTISLRRWYLQAHVKLCPATPYQIAGSNVRVGRNPKLATISVIVFINKASRLTVAWTNTTRLQRILSEHRRTFVAF